MLVSLENRSIIPAALKFDLTPFPDFRVSAAPDPIRSLSASDPDGAGGDDGGHNNDHNNDAVSVAPSNRSFKDKERGGVERASEVETAIEPAEEPDPSGPRADRTCATGNGRADTHGGSPGPSRDGAAHALPYPPVARTQPLQRAVETRNRTI